ncbi:hypothetical protein AYI70_g2890 [Smittium culicis]|uniref:Uncharacterized protein n=1 Tax=Smittium culicis TaxID=133412 RepID=A0A1R1XK22_9FUNG|nr:hypothetical protein AYI70_g7580 [Smittium culicis]OMJ22417.1 hypothetical protein AYI70_g2890 [Smittium culicis]
MEYNWNEITKLLHNFENEISDPVSEVENSPIRQRKRLAESEDFKRIRYYGIYPSDVAFLNSTESGKNQTNQDNITVQSKNSEDEDHIYQTFGLLKKQRLIASEIDLIINILLNEGNKLTQDFYKTVDLSDVSEDNAVAIIDAISHQETASFFSIKTFLIALSSSKISIIENPSRDLQSSIANIGKSKPKLFIEGVMFPLMINQISGLGSLFCSIVENYSHQLVEFILK